MPTEAELLKQWLAEGRDPRFFPRVVPPTDEDMAAAREGWGD